MRTILEELGKRLNFHLVAVHLTDAQCILDTSKYLSNVFLSLAGMMQTEMPFINVMSKCNLLSKVDRPKFRLSYFTDCSNLEHLLMAEQRAEEARCGGEK